MGTLAHRHLCEPVFSYLGRRPRSGTTGPDGNAMSGFWRNLPNILFSFFLSSLVWNQLLSGSGFGASFPFSRSRCAVLICGDSRRMKPTSDNTEHGDCRKPRPANAWGCWYVWQTQPVGRQTSRGLCGLLTEQPHLGFGLLHLFLLIHSIADIVSLQCVASPSWKKGQVSHCTS